MSTCSGNQDTSCDDSQSSSDCEERQYSPHLKRFKPESCGESKIAEKNGEPSNLCSTKAIFKHDDDKDCSSDSSDTCDNEKGQNRIDHTEKDDLTGDALKSYLEHELITPCDDEFDEIAKLCENYDL